MKILIIHSKGGVGKSTIALALADVLEGAQIIDLDPQKSITKAAQLTGRHLPVELTAAKSRYLIIDTPPYRTADSNNLLKSADVILIPAKASLLDLQAADSIVTDIRRLGLQKKARFVFNDVPYRKGAMYNMCLEFFQSNFDDILRCKTELRTYNAFRFIISEPLAGRALQQAQDLASEILNI